MGTLCDHFQEAAPGAARLTDYLDIGYYDGLTDGIVRCVLCRTYFYVRAIAFSFHQQAPTNGSRVFAVYPMPASAAAECEAIRGHWDRLHATGRVKHGNATPSLRKRLASLARRRRAPARVLCWDLHENTWLAVAAVPPTPRLPAANAIERSTPESDLAWFRYLGLARPAA
jgi:hypothetical protein